jgi:hypothetical protein
MPKAFTTVTVRERPALYSVPGWQNKDKSVEAYRDARKKYNKWEIGIWGEDTEIIGLLIGGVSTHYAFYLEDVLDNPRFEEGCHFDAGTSCRELFVEPDEWKRVLNELLVAIGHPSVQHESKEDQ